MLFVVVMGTLWSVILATESGVRNVNPIYVRAHAPWARAGCTPGCSDHAGSLHHRQRHEAGLGLRLALAHGRRDFVTILTGFGLGQLLHYGRELNAMDQVIASWCHRVHRLLADKVLFSPWESFCTGAGHRQ